VINLFWTEEIRKCWIAEQENVKAYWKSIENCRFPDAISSAAVVNKSCQKASASFGETTAAEILLNDLFLMERLAALLNKYALYWNSVQLKQFSESWSLLQDIQDSLRTLFRFGRDSNAAILKWIEKQTGDLEILYPYKIFASAEMVYSSLECSICGIDMSDSKCPHIAGNLYNGKFACGIIRDVIDFQGVALVENPLDKRCVVTIPNQSPSFKRIAFLGNALSERTLNPLSFAGASERVKKIQLDQANIGRNALCPCRSGKKFKNCCLKKGYIEGKHIDIHLGANPLVPSLHVTQKTLNEGQSYGKPDFAA